MKLKKEKKYAIIKKKKRKTINQIIVLSSIPPFPFFLTKPRDLLLSKKVIISLKNKKLRNETYPGAMQKMGCGFESQILFLQWCF